MKRIALIFVVLLVVALAVGAVAVAAGSDDEPSIDDIQKRSPGGGGAGWDNVE